MDGKNFFTYIPEYEKYNSLECYTKYMKLVNPHYDNLRQNLLNNMVQLHYHLIFYKIIN